MRLMRPLTAKRFPTIDLPQRNFNYNLNIFINILRRNCSITRNQGLDDVSLPTMNKILNNLLRPLSLVGPVSIRSVRNFEKKDPGIRKRAAILEENIHLEDELDDFEADFFGLGKSYKQHQHEAAASRELIKYRIVRQKYFKEKLPNFLTWADKQQIKHLHNTDPEEWSVERLAEGFPALPETIEKIVKNNWVPNNVNRIRRHDKGVQENWQLFKTKKHVLKLPSSVIMHLDKFTTRELNLNPDITTLQVQDISKFELVKKGGEFSNIIQSYEVLKENNLAQSHPGQNMLHKLNTTSKKSKELVVTSSISQNCQEFDNFEEPKLKKKDSLKMLTCDELQTKLIHKKYKFSAHGQYDTNVQAKDCLVVVDDGNESKEIVLCPKELNLNISKFKSTESEANVYKPVRDYKNLVYPERIKIPADKCHKGYTYKLNDCFYDADGEFLYRVPGMY